MKKVYGRIMGMALAAVALLLFGRVPPAPGASSVSNPDKMEVHFIDVGQGDATLITCGGHAMLIDAGDDSKGTAIQNYLQKRNIDTLDYLILTHPDSDHIGGAPTVITKFRIGEVFVSNFEKDNRTYQKLIQALDDKRLKAAAPSVGARYTLGSATITILAPGREYDDPNNASIALSVSNGGNRFLFTGDAEEEAERDILGNGLDVSADVYKAGHHGSRSSTSEEFFAAVHPRYAVISCAEGNSYGHPHAATMNTFRTNGVEVYRTDEQGSIIAVSDGQAITFSVPASRTWQSGEPSGSLAAQVPGREAGAGIKETAGQLTYVLNIKTKKFHKPSCGSLPVSDREDSCVSRESLIAQGYVPCKGCNP